MDSVQVNTQAVIRNPETIPTLPSHFTSQMGDVSWHLTGWMAFLLVFNFSEMQMQFRNPVKVTGVLERTWNLRSQPPHLQNYVGLAC